jgi:uncharacterized protein (TIGR02099 family)
MTASPPVLPPAPSRWLRATHVVASRLLWLLLGAWLLFGILWGALHWVIVPRIGDFRPLLESQASKALGVPVTVGSITAKSQGMIPSFELVDVKLLDTQGQAALWLPKVMVALSPQSLAGLGFEQIYIERPQLSIKRSESGKLTIAGLDFSKNEKGDGSAADWFFSQTEFVVRHGSIQWTDEMRKLPVLALSDVDLVSRNRYRKHELRLDAVLPPSMGTRVSAMGTFRQPLLSLHNGKWQDWEGQIYTAFNSVDVAVLNRYVGAELEVAQGQGGLHAWADVRKGYIAQATVDVTLAQLNVRLAKDLQPLALKTVQGRLGGSILADGFEFWTEGLQFETQDGLRWPGGNVRVNYSGESILGKPAAVAVTASQPALQVVSRGSIKADKLDLAALSQIANRLPLGEQAHAALAAWSPKGVVETLQAGWQGQPGGHDKEQAKFQAKYQVKGRVVGFEITPNVVVPKLPGPSIQGLAADFDLTEGGGKAKLVVNNGSLSLPGIFDDALIPLTQLSADAQWTVAGERIAVQIPNLKFSNADGQGEAQVKWHTSDVLATNAAGSTKAISRFPGTLDLQGTLSRLDGTRVYRYLPSLMRANVREYVREAIQKGVATDVKFKAKGNIYDMPFANPKLGEFLISAKMNNAVFAYVPQSLALAGRRPWPVLTDINGELVIERLKLQVKGVTGSVGTGLQITKAEGQIADLQNAPTVVVSAEARGGATDALTLVNSSPLGELISGALANSTVTGNSDIKLKLNLPIGAIDKTTVQGSVNLSGNDFQYSPTTPLLAAARGLLNFTERGFSLANVQGRMFGGEIALDGGSQALLAPPTASRPAVTVQATRDSPNIVLKAKGTMTAEALRQMKDYGFIARLAQQASGSAAYAATLSFNAGVPELQFSSDLVGLASNLPAPLNKPAESALPIRYENSLLADKSLEKAPALDQIKLDVGRIASLAYVRDVSGPDARVLRGTLAVGLATDESAPMPADGVAANVNMARLDLDAWSAVLTQATGVKLAVPEVGTSAIEPTASTPAALAGDATLAAPRPRGAANPALGYLPNVMAIRAGELVVGGRKLTNLVVGGSREGLTWRANLQANELNGYAEYRQPLGNGPGRVYARLARLTLAQASAKEVEALLDEQPSSIPALDIVIEDMELRGKKLGRIEVEATNRGAGAPLRDGGAREWRLAKFNVITPEAVFTAKGNWADINAQTPRLGADLAPAGNERRRTAMTFTLDIADAGDLLARFGMKDVFRRGKGKMEGQVSWVGSPITPDYPSMGGAFTVNMEQGQFLKADPGLAKLLGVLSLQSLPRRLALDFRDVFTDGFSFDFVRGDIKIDQGIASTNNLQMKGVNAAVLMDGQADISKETQKVRVIVVPEINAGTASLIAAAINPAVGLGTFLAQIFLRGPLIEAATQEFLIDGTWVDPQVTPVKRKTQSGAANPSEVTR